MKTNPPTPTNIDEYIAGYPDDVQKCLEKIRMTIRKAAPDAQEAIKYTIPTFTLNGNMISFAAYKKHVAIYPAPAGNEKFQKELAPYKTAKSTVQLPLDKPMPYGLITKLVKFRVKEHLQNVKTKGKKK